VLASGTPTTLSVRVTEPDLNRAAGLYRIDLSPGDFAVSGKAGVLFVRAGFRLHGTLAPTPENQLVFAPRALSYGGVPIPRPVWASAVKRLNPVFDMARFLGSARAGLDVRFERVVLSRGEVAVHLSGRIHGPSDTAPEAPRARLDDRPDLR
jgi:hypothetical protein